MKATMTLGFCACKTLISQSKPPEDWSSINLLWEIADMDDEFEINGLPARKWWTNEKKIKINHTYSMHAHVRLFDNDNICLYQNCTV